MSDSFQPVDSSSPGSSVHGILQERILKRLPFPPPGYLVNPGTEPGSPALQSVSLPSAPPAKPEPKISSQFYFIYLNNFYWSVVNSQCWVSSAVHKSESIIHIHISSLFKILFHIDY